MMKKLINLITNNIIHYKIIYILYMYIYMCLNNMLYTVNYITLLQILQV